MPALSAATLPLLLLPLAIPAVLAYFFQVRPRRRRAGELAALQGRLRVGDRVATCGGLHATVIALTEQTVDLEACPGVIHRYDRVAIARLVS